MYFINQTLEQMGFWVTWLLIPLLFEIIPTIYYFFVLLSKSKKEQKIEIPEKLPMISLLVPVYNSEDTLYACIKSIYNSTYPNNLIQVILANNKSTDNSFSIYNEIQNDFQDLHVQWINTAQGKARALNSAIYSSMGNYVINLDSDGILEKNALMNMILRFENDITVDAMTGVILTQKELISESKRIGEKFLRNNEYVEYAQAFLSGRSIESESNRLFTMSGAFSGFRKRSLLRTFLYNTETVGEDTDITFQIRDRLKGRVILCEDAIFFVDPIDDFNKLYMQRQRWQRGEIEVSQSFVRKKVKLSGFFKNFMVRRLMIDHTFVFPRLIWFFGIAVLWYLGYQASILGLSMILMYLLYVFNSLLNYLNVSRFLKKFNSEYEFYRSRFWVVFTLPIYNLICSFIRLVGILNSITTPAKWGAKGINKECSEIIDIVKSDIKRKESDKNDHTQL